MPDLQAIEVGKRNSADDQSKIQNMHDHAVALGASCGMSESHVSHETTDIKLTESAETTEVIRIQEARSDYEIKLIAPGKGSSAFYPQEVLQRDGPKVFKAGTHVYLNHPTAAEEAMRPEGDVANLAGVLTTSAVYHENHSKGPGLYGRMKVFADHAQLVEEKAAHVGMSIRASGIAEAGRMREGVPILKELTGAESVDVVTKAGAGGMILTESAAAPVQSKLFESKQEVSDMDAAELTALKESLAAQAETNRKLLERAIRGDAREEAGRILASVTLHEAAKNLVIESVLKNIPTKDGGLDVATFTEAVNAEAKLVGAAFAAATGSGRVTGMGAAPVEIKPEEAARRAAAAKADDENAVAIFESLGMPNDAAKLAAKGRAA